MAESLYRMHILLIMIALISGISGLYVGFRMLKQFNFLIYNVVSFWRKLRVSLLAGVTGCLIFFSLMMIARSLDNNFSLTFNYLARALLTSLIPGFFISAGTMLRIFMVSARRRNLNKSINRNKPG